MEYMNYFRSGLPTLICCIIGDEYQVVFECSNANISLQRNRFIPTYFRQNRSMFNIVKLLQSVDDIKVGRRVSSFVLNSNIV